MQKHNPSFSSSVIILPRTTDGHYGVSICGSRKDYYYKQ